MSVVQNVLQGLKQPSKKAVLVSCEEKATKLPNEWMGSLSSVPTTTEELSERTKK